MNGECNHLTVNDYPELFENKYYIQGTFNRVLMAAIHDHNFYEINYVLEGGCSHIVNGIPIKMSVGDISILRPGDSHGFSSQLPHTNLMSLSVCVEEVDRFFYAYGTELQVSLCNASEPPFFHLTAHQQNDFRTEFEQILIMDPLQRRIRIKILLDRALQFYMLRLEHPPFGNAINSHLTEALARFNSPENIREGVPALLRLSNFSHAQLCRVMKKSLNVTPQQYVVTLRMNLAMELIQDSEIELETIVAHVGYASASHFNMIFTNRFGMTPAQARRKMRMKTI